MNHINEFNEFRTLHKPQLLSSGIPVHLWQPLFEKLSQEIFDAGNDLQLLLIDYDDEEDASTGAVYALAVANEDGIKASNSNAIYLVDHAWTFRLDMARAVLTQHQQLCARLCRLMGIDEECEERVQLVLRRMWRYCQAYTLGSGSAELSDESRAPIWYIMDEVGSAVNHSDEPNFRIVPFFHIHRQITYSVLFPIRDCEPGEYVTRDWCEYVAKSAAERPVLLLPWRAADFRAHSFVQTEPEAEYFTTGHIPETYPAQVVEPTPPRSGDAELKVYSEYDVLSAHLTAPRFALVDNPADADILWLTHHYKEFAALNSETPHKFINQFPFEYVLTIKDLLSITCRRAAEEHHNAATLDTYPAWLPTTFNLKTELPQFASYYQQRADKQLDNHWIIKPWNLARGIDTHITDDIVQIVRMPATGPKIAQKYIENPVLFHRAELDAKVKFDVRYVLLLKSVQPLEAYVHRKFYLRFANRAFALDNFDNYEQHFTVMNYLEASELHHVKCDDFLQYWREQYPDHEWQRVEQDICAMLHEMLVCATARASPPCAIAHCPQSRALYAADIMLAWAEDKGGKRYMQPKLLEVNWTPDCQRACDYYPDFFNDIFKLLFLNEGNEESFRLLGEGSAGQ